MSLLVLNPAAMQRLLASPAGPVGRELSRRAVRVESQAKINASGRPGPKVQTGRLRSSITWHLGIDGRGLFARIGTNVSYARGIELGNPPHTIVAVNKQALFWKGAAHPVRVVHHPGNRPMPFLRPALAAARL